MNRSSWDTVWADVAQAVSRRSSCDRAQVGAAIVKDSRVVATGYNGPAATYPADTDQGCSAWCARARAAEIGKELGYGYACPSIHAEANALLHASRAEVEGSTLYVTQPPCADCAKLISNSGVAEVISLQEQEAHRPDPRPYFEMCGIGYYVVEPQTGGL